MDPVKAKDVKRHERWTFELLTESKPLTRYCNVVLEEFRAYHERFYKNTGFHHRFEWCLLLDNSGSMITKVGPESQHLTNQSMKV